MEKEHTIITIKYSIRQAWWSAVIIKCQKNLQYAIYILNNILNKKGSNVISVANFTGMKFGGCENKPIKKIMNRTLYIYYASVKVNGESDAKSQTLQQAT